MAQSRKAAQAQEASQSNPQDQKQSDQNQVGLQDILKQTLAPLTQTVSSLQQQLDDIKQRQTAKADEYEVERLREKSDLDAMFDDIDDDKFERLTNKQLIDVVADAVDGAIKASNELVKKDLIKQYQKDMQRLEGLEKATMGVIAHLGLSDVRNKFSDFDEFKEDIGKVMEKYPNIGYEDAYFIAKSKKAGAVPPRSSVESERPDSFGTAPTGGRASEKTAPLGDDAFATMAARGRQARQYPESDSGEQRSGIVGFRDLVNRSLDRLLESE